MPVDPSQPEDSAQSDQLRPWLHSPRATSSVTLRLPGPHAIQAVAEAGPATATNAISASVVSIPWPAVPHFAASPATSTPAPVTQQANGGLGPANGGLNVTLSLTEIMQAIATSTAAASSLSTLAPPPLAALSRSPHAAASEPDASAEAIAAAGRHVQEPCPITSTSSDSDVLSALKALINAAGVGEPQKPPSPVLQNQELLQWQQQMHQLQELLLQQQQQEEQKQQEHQCWVSCTPGSSALPLSNPSAVLLPSHIAFIVPITVAYMPQSTASALLLNSGCVREGRDSSDVHVHASDGPSFGVDLKLSITEAEQLSSQTMHSPTQQLLAVGPSATQATPVAAPVCSPPPLSTSIFSIVDQSACGNPSAVPHPHGVIEDPQSVADGLPHGGFLVVPQTLPLFPASELEGYLLVPQLPGRLPQSESVKMDTGTLQLESASREDYAVDEAAAVASTVHGEKRPAAGSVMEREPSSWLPTCHPSIPRVGYFGDGVLESAFAAAAVGEGFARLEGEVKRYHVDISSTSSWRSHPLLQTNGSGNVSRCGSASTLPSPAFSLGVSHAHMARFDE